jgi:hypothetical protein
LSTARIAPYRASIDCASRATNAASSSVINCCATASVCDHTTELKKLEWRGGGWQLP